MAETIIRALGWQPFDDQDRALLAKYPKCVMIYPHTSYYDFCLYILYQMADPILQRRCRILINPSFTENFQWLLKYIGSIEATRREIRNGGATRRICRELEKLDEFIFALSPKGSMEPNHAWRSGFYHIAKQMGCPVMPAGFDYVKKKFIFQQPFYIDDMTFEQACAEGKKRLFDIIPCHPDRSEYPLALHDKSKACLMPFWRWLVLWVLMLILLVAAVCLLIWAKRRLSSGVT